MHSSECGVGGIIHSWRRRGGNIFLLLKIIDFIVFSLLFRSNENACRGSIGIAPPSVEHIKKLFT